jgi:hypothetical protein
MDIRSVYVDTIKLESGEEVEIRRLPGGALVGLDGSFLAQMEDEDVVVSPYDGTPFGVPVSSHEEGEE